MNPIIEFAGLRSKMYAMRTKNGDEKKTANGVSRRVTNWEIKHDDYKRCLIEDEVMYHSMMRIGHTHHQLESIETLKKSLSPYNDKKWINKNGGEFKTYSFGDKNISSKYKYIYIYIYTYIKYSIFTVGELETVLTELIKEGNDSEKSE